MREAMIFITRKDDPKGNPEQFTYEWEGPKDGILRVSEPLLDELRLAPDIPRQWGAIGEIISIGPYQLKIFEFEGRGPTYHLVRIDSLLGNIKVIAYRLTRWLDLAYRRLIITASVWRLAEYRPECYPSWEDLYLYKWLQYSNGKILNRAISLGLIDDEKIKGFPSWKDLSIVQRFRK